ncbi:hypothetical protein BH18GEM1_BH18GEM1_18970 [soil metagenome]
MRRWLPTAMLAVMGLAWPVGVSAQAPGKPLRFSGWELNLHAATLFDNLFEESGQVIQAGARVLRATASGFGFGGNFDYARTTDVLVSPGLSGLTANLLLFSAEVDYTIPVSPRAEFFVGAGVGGVSLQFSTPPTAPANFAESSTGQLVPVAAGFRLRNREVDPSWAIRFDARDNIIFLTTIDPASRAESQEPRNNFELSGGFSFLFGAGPQVSRPETPAREPAARGREPERTRDADGDGVVDPRDQCPATPAGRDVDSFGCPVPYDADADGVVDDLDRCADSPIGRPVGRDGCPVGDAQPPVQPPAPDADRDNVPEARPQAPSDTDLDGVADAQDRCVNTRRGAAVDAKGCPVPELEPAPAEPTPAEPAQAEPAPAACVDNRAWFQSGGAIEFDGLRYTPLGTPEPITEDNLTRVGQNDGVPIFVGILAPEPYADLWLPHCTPSGTYQLYVAEGGG